MLDVSTQDAMFMRSITISVRRIITAAVRISPFTCRLQTIRTSSHDNFVLTEISGLFATLPADSAAVILFYTMQSVKDFVVIWQPEASPSWLGKFAAKQKVGC